MASVPVSVQDERPIAIGSIRECLQDWLQRCGGPSDELREFTGELVVVNNDGWRKWVDWAQNDEAAPPKNKDLLTLIVYLWSMGYRLDELARIPDTQRDVCLLIGLELVDLDAALATLTVPNFATFLRIVKLQSPAQDASPEFNLGVTELLQRNSSRLRRILQLMRARAKDVLEPPPSVETLLSPPVITSGGTVAGAVVALANSLHQLLELAASDSDLEARLGQHPGAAVILGSVHRRTQAYATGGGLTQPFLPGPASP